MFRSLELWLSLIVVLGAIFALVINNMNMAWKVEKHAQRKLEYDKACKVRDMSHKDFKLISDEEREAGRELSTHRHHRRITVAALLLSVATLSDYFFRFF